MDRLQGVFVALTGRLELLVHCHCSQILEMDRMGQGAQFECTTRDCGGQLRGCGWWTLLVHYAYEIGLDLMNAG